MLIHNRSFWLVFSSFLLPSASHLLTIYAFSFYLLEHYAENPEYVSTAELMNTLPVLAGFLLIGLAVDRFHRKRLALASLAFRFIFAAGILVCLSFDWLAGLFLMLLLRMFFHKMFVTMEMAIIQGLLEPHQFVKVASLKQFINGTLAITGSFIALYVYRQWGMAGIMAIDCLFTVASYLLMRRVEIPSTASLPNGPLPSALQSLSTLWFDMKQGFIYVWSGRTLRSFLLAFIVFGLLNAVLATLPLYSMRYELTNDVAVYQNYAVWFTFTLGSSFVVGSLTSSLWRNTQNAETLIKICMLLLCFLVTALGFIPVPLLFFITVFVVGYIIVLINIRIGGWLPRIVEPAFMGRAYALLDPASLGAKTLGLLICGWVFPHLLPLTSLYLLFGALLLLGTVSVWRLLK